VIKLAFTNGLVPADVAQITTAAIAVSMVLTPFLAAGARALAAHMERIENQAHMPKHRELSGHIIIGGYGRVGQTIARMLAAENVPFIALDSNAAVVTRHRKTGVAVFFGDASRGELLKRAGAEQARGFVVTVNSARAAERMVVAARKLRPDAPVFARARDRKHATRLLRVGAIKVTAEAVEVSLQLGARLLEELGIPEDGVARRIEVLRAQELPFEHPD